MVSLVLSALTGFFVSLVLLPLIIRYANKKNLVVALDQRKIHKRVTPSMGGLAIFAGLIPAALFWANSHEFVMSSKIVFVLFIPFLLGLIDDRFHLKASTKIIGQLVAATCVYWLLDVKLISLYGLIGDVTFPSWLSYLITVVTIVLLTNSFNLIDGIDGLAGTFAVTALLFFGFWFSLADQYAYAGISLGLVGSVTAFLIKNWQPSKIFMGDTGSLVLGTSLAVLAIAFLNHNAALPEFSSIKFNSGIGAALCILIVPIVDTIRVVVIRLSRGISPLTADKRHIHHALVRIGKSHRFAVILLFVVHIFFISNALLLKRFHDWYVIGCVVVFSCLLCFILDKVVARHTYARKPVRSAIKIKDTEPVNF